MERPDEDAAKAELKATGLECNAVWRASPAEYSLLILLFEDLAR